jgi:hypothetical protein
MRESSIKGKMPDMPYGAKVLQGKFMTSLTSSHDNSKQF